MAVTTPPLAVIIGFVWPEPDSSAAGQNMMGIIHSLLHAGFSVVFMTAAKDSPHRASLTDTNLTVENVSLNDESFDARIAALQPTLVCFDRFMTEEQFSARVKTQCPNALRLLNTEDLHFLRQHRHQSIKENGYATPLSSTVNSDIAHREVAAILRSDLTLVIADYEYALLRDRYNVPESQLLHLPLFNSPVFPPFPDFEDRHGFAFIGNFRHAPNWDAVLRLREIWPLIRQRVPEATLSIYGAYPPPKAMALHAPKLGFLVKGWAENAAQTLARHKVLLAPLRFGAGIKGKLVLAMQVATPSVTSPVGAEGIAEESLWPGAVCTDTESFVEHAIRLYEDRSAWQSASEAGKEIIAQKFNNERSRHRLSTTITAIIDDIEAHRQPLFWQGMLWHHTLKSTQYMTQWIEAKNRRAN